MAELVMHRGQKVPILAEAEVVVAGAGLAGVAAALSAARAGAGTILVEQHALVGGVATAGLMTSMTNAIFTGDGRQVVRGVAEEMLEGLAARGGATPHWRTRSLPQIPYDQEVFRPLLAEKLDHAGVEVLLEMPVCDVARAGETLLGLVVETASGRQALLGKVFVDATGDAQLAFLTGAEWRNATPHSGSLLFQMRGADLDRFTDYFEAHPQEWPQYCDRVTPLEGFLANWRERSVLHFPHGGGRHLSLVQDAIARGEYTTEWGLCEGMDVLGLYAYGPAGTVLVNSCNFAIDHLEPQMHSQAAQDARQVLPRVAEFLREHLPGFEEAYLSETAAAVGVRGTRWIKGEVEVTAEDVATGLRADDVVGAESAFQSHPRGGVVYTDDWHDIPYRALLARGAANLIVGSGKTASTRPRGLLRGQVGCYVIGQAAGVAAALAARGGLAARAVPIAEVQHQLLEQGAWLGDGKRLRQLGL